MAYTKLKPRHTPSARVDEISSDSSHYLLTILYGKADGYRLAQLDDYTQIPKRRLFPHRFGQGPSHPSLTRPIGQSEQRLGINLSLSARTSSDSIPGTWGFGLWNDPFGLSIGFGGKPFRLPALPNAVWFFGASQENYLSFRDPRAERRSKTKDEAPLTNRASTAFVAKNTPSSAQRETAANGFLAQSFRSPRFHPLLILAGMMFPFSRKLTRRLMSQVIAEDGVNLSSRRSLAPSALDASRTDYAREETVSVDPTHWHRYRLEWSRKRVSFDVDEVQVFESDVSPNPPLGLVIWIDNQYAAFTPEGKIGFGVLANPEPVWLEIEGLEVS